jgi:hypothetical protein
MTIKLYSNLLAISLLALSHLSFVPCVPTNDKELTITNKTLSDIDAIHFIFKGKDSGDVLGDYEILHPDESVSVKFDCTQIGRNKVTVKLFFDDGKTYSFEDDVCESDFTWEITDDGGHHKH